MNEFESIEDELKFMADCSDNLGDSETSLMFVRYLAHIRKMNAELAALKAGQGEAVAIAECREVHGHMCQFLNRTQHGMDTLRDGDKLYTAPPATGVIDPSWRCFQCDEHFNDSDSAALHFGTHQHQSPACLIDIAEYRAMEARMHSYNEEDAEIHRAMARMHGQHRAALQREEEKGYAQALKDIGYNASAEARLVPVELLKRIVDQLEIAEINEPLCCDVYACIGDILALLAQSNGVKP